MDVTNATLQYAKKLILDSNITQVHRKMKEFGCVQCDDIRNHKSMLYMHIKMVHMTLVHNMMKFLTCDNV